MICAAIHSGHRRDAAVRIHRRASRRHRRADEGAGSQPAVAVGLEPRDRVWRAALSDAAVRDPSVGGDGDTLLERRDRLHRHAAWRGVVGGGLQRRAGRSRLRRHLPGHHRDRGRAERADHRRRISYVEPLPRHRDRRSGDGAHAAHRTDSDPRRKSSVSGRRLTSFATSSIPRCSPFTR